MGKYFYDPDKNVIINKKGKEFELRFIIDDIFKGHIKTVLSFKGFLFRSRMFTRELFTNFFGSMIRLLKSVLKIWGRELKDSDFKVELFHTYSKKDLLTTSDERIEFTWIRNMAITKKVFIIMCLTGTILYFVDYFHENPIITFYESYSDSALFNICFLIVLFFVFDVIIPYTILFLINTLIRIRTWMFTRKIKV